MWKKILIGLVVFIVLLIALVSFLTGGLSDVANKQLDALKKGDITTAYSYTSKDFQANTSVKDFEKFLKKYPSLKNNQKASWSERSVSGSTGVLKGTLTAADGGVTPAEYHFVKENNEWKILGIVVNQAGTKIIPLSKTETSDADKARGEIHQVLVSDVQGSQRSVDKTKTVIPAKAPKIYVSAYIAHAKAGLKVTAEMVRMANGAKIGPSVATITQDGNIIRDFSFTNTEASWPVGDYQINVATSNGQSATVDFKIE